MKKVVSLLLVLMMALSLLACGKEPKEKPAKEAEEPQTVFDFGSYVAELKNAEYAMNEYGRQCLVITFAYTNKDPENTGRMGENIDCIVVQNGEEMSPTVFKYYQDQEPYWVHEGETLDFYECFNLNNGEGDEIYDYVNEMKVTLKDMNSDKSYSFTIDPATLEK